VELEPLTTGWWPTIGKSPFNPVQLQEILVKALLLTTALAAGFALPAIAQDAASPFQAEAMGPSISASDVIGARIYVTEAAIDADAYSGVQEGWEDIGEVNDIILGRDGTVDAVLVDIGGFLGIGERQVAVDMAALKIVQDDATDADDWFLVLQSDRGRWKVRRNTCFRVPSRWPKAMRTSMRTRTSTPMSRPTRTWMRRRRHDPTGTATDEAVAESTTAEGTEGVGNATTTEMPADGQVAGDNAAEVGKADGA
jgi:hypothetical protein